MKIRIGPLDSIFSRIVRARADGTCEYCGGKGTQTSHFHSRRKRSVRFDLDNCIWACFSCHMYLGEHPNKHADFFRKRLGPEKYEELNIRAEQIVKIDKNDLKEKLKKMEGISKS